MIYVICALCIGCIMITQCSVNSVYIAVALSEFVFPFNSALNWILCCCSRNQEE